MSEAIPSFIFNSRDGVGDGQIPYIVEHEIKAIRKSFKQAYGSEDQVKVKVLLKTE